MSSNADQLLFRDRVEKAVSHASRFGREAALLWVRLEGADEATDRNALARKVAGCTRYPDSVFQLDPWAFAVLMSELSRPEEAGLLALRLGQAVAREGAGGVTAHVGIAVAPLESRDPDALIRLAGKAAEGAAAAGDGLRFSRGELNRVAGSRVALSRDLPRALDADELTLHYHLQQDLAMGRVTVAEALLRWQHPQRGLLLPIEFVPLAEAFGPLDRLTDWVLRRACEDAGSWPDRQVRIAVNLSPRQLDGADAVNRISRVLTDCGFPPDRLEIEITESAVMGDMDGAAHQLRRLRDLGIGLALDDFGTGYSTLTLVKHLPVTKLKIDRSFIRGLGVDRGDAAIVRALIDLGLGLGLEIVAEGVETQEQIAYLREAGCTAVQGDGVGEPLPAAEVPARLHGSR